MSFPQTLFKQARGVGECCFSTPKKITHSGSSLGWLVGGPGWMGKRENGLEWGKRKKGGMPSFSCSDAIIPPLFPFFPHLMPTWHLSNNRKKEEETKGREKQTDRCQYFTNSLLSFPRLSAFSSLEGEKGPRHALPIFLSKLEFQLSHVSSSFLCFSPLLSGMHIEKYLRWQGKEVEGEWNRQVWQPSFLSSPSLFKVVFSFRLSACLNSFHVILRVYCAMLPCLFLILRLHEECTVPSCKYNMRFKQGLFGRILSELLLAVCEEKM